ncbi:MAG: hypothetical protein EBZ47_01135 [Chlamydiae bacterium]|nr:hypothetical protein [Chlamydiota bacterium]
MSKFKWMALCSSVVLFQPIFAKQTASCCQEKYLASTTSCDGSVYRFPTKNMMISHQEEWKDNELFLTYEPKDVSVNSIENIKKRWAMLCAEEIVKQRLTNHHYQKRFEYDVFNEAKSFSPSFLSIQTRYSEVNELEIVSEIEKVLDEVIGLGIEIDEMAPVVEDLLIKVQSYLEDEKTKDGLDHYQSLESEYLQENPQYCFQDFLEISKQCLQELTQEDVSGAFSLYFEPTNKVVESFSPSNVQISSMLANARDFAVTTSNPFSEIEKDSVQGFATLKRGLSLNPSLGNVDDYRGLRLTSTDQKLIRKIITNMSDKNIFQLLLDKKSMEKKGKLVRPVHPLRFIGYICADPLLRRCLHDVSKNYFKWSNFIEGFADRMKEESSNGRLLPYVNGLASDLNADPEAIASYIYSGNYEGLVKYLL